MADSEFQRPTLAENISMLRNDLFARLDVSDTLRRMDEDVRAKVYAAALHTVYGYIDYLAMNMLPDLCDSSGTTMSAMRLAYNGHRHRENGQGSNTDKPDKAMEA